MLHLVKIRLWIEVEPTEEKEKELHQSLKDIMNFKPAYNLIMLHKNVIIHMVWIVFTVKGKQNTTHPGECKSTVTWLSVQLVTFVTLNTIQHVT